MNSKCTECTCVLTILVYSFGYWQIASRIMAIFKAHKHGSALVTWSKTWKLSRKNKQTNKKKNTITRDTSCWVNFWDALHNLFSSWAEWRRYTCTTASLENFQNWTTGHTSQVVEPHAINSNVWQFQNVLCNTWNYYTLPISMCVKKIENWFGWALF